MVKAICVSIITFFEGVPCYSCVCVSFLVVIRGVQVHSREVKFPGKESGSRAKSGYPGLVLNYRELTE